MLYNVFCFYIFRVTFTAGPLSLQTIHNSPPPVLFSKEFVQRYMLGLPLKLSRMTPMSTSLSSQKYVSRNEGQSKRVLLKCHTPAEIPLKAILCYSEKMLQLEF